MQKRLLPLYQLPRQYHRQPNQHTLNPRRPRRPLNRLWSKLYLRRLRPRLWSIRMRRPRRRVQIYNKQTSQRATSLYRHHNLLYRRHHLHEQLPQYTKDPMHQKQANLSLRRQQHSSKPLKRKSSRPSRPTLRQHKQESSPRPKRSLLHPYKR